MKGAVNDEEIKKFKELLHLIDSQDVEAKASASNELKGLPSVDIAVIGLVAMYPGLLVGEIAQALHVPNSTLTSALNRLEKKEIVRRVVTPRDQRAFGVQLTEKGAELHQAHAECELADLKRILAKLDTHEERELLFYLLNKMTVASG